MDRRIYNNGHIEKTSASISRGIPCDTSHLGRYQVEKTPDAGVQKVITPGQLSRTVGGG